MRRVRCLLLTLGLIACAAIAQAQTATPTSTPTQTPTTTPQRQNNIASDATCAATPCSLTASGREAVAGYKSVGVLATGTVTAQVRCQIGDADVQIGTDVTTTGYRDFETACNWVYIRITAGAGSVSAWLNRWVAGR